MVTPAEWLAAWTDSLASFQTIAVVGLALIAGASFLRLIVSIVKGAMRT